jgi:hypothetical protein
MHRIVAIRVWVSQALYQRRRLVRERGDGGNIDLTGWARRSVGFVMCQSLQFIERKPAKIRNSLFQTFQIADAEYIQVCITQSRDRVAFNLQ